MLKGPVSFVKACKDYFGMEGTEMIADFRKLSHTDKLELREGLIGEGYEVDPLGEPVVEMPALVGVQFILVAWTLIQVGDVSVHFGWGLVILLVLFGAAISSTINIRK